MKQYDIVRRKTPGKDKWTVLWDGEVIYQCTGKAAEFLTGAFARGLEQGITGSKQALDANSQIQLEGVFYGYPDCHDAADLYYY